jgi:Fe2+-dicitrate sensor, membrane component
MKNISQYSLDDLLNEERVVRAIQQEKHLNDKEVEQLLYRIKERYHARHVRSLKLLLYSIAATIAILIFSGVGVYLWQSATSEPSYSLSAMAKLLPESTDIQLILGSRRYVFAQDVDIQLKGTEAIVVEKKSGKTYTYLTDSHLKLNKLYTPKGKCSTITLDDGTKVWINSGTSFVFPTRFIGTNRVVNLNGEAYMAVAKNIAKPFIVHTSTFDVRVTGTRFNVIAYKGDSNMSVVLAEGGVQLTSRDKKYLINMIPNEMATVSNGRWTVDNIVADDYICWKDGYLQLSGVSLDDIFLRLSRHYNVDIQWDHKAARQRCSGKLVLFDDVDKIMTSLSSIFNIKYIRTNNNIRIILKP